MQVHRERERIRARGGEVHVIGNGAPHDARAFHEDLGLGIPLFTDPSLRTYRELGFRRSVARTFAPRTLARAVGAFRAGFRQGRTKGDPFQLGGVVVVRRDGTLAYRYASEENGDHPPIDAILEALAGADTMTAS